MRPSSNLHVFALLRKVLEMNQTDFSEVAGCSLSTVQAVELGRLKLSESLAVRVSVETGVDHQWLLANDLTAPIPLSRDAGKYYSMFSNLVPRTYSKETFDLVQAEKLPSGEHNPVYQEQLRGLDDYARLRAVIETARKDKRYKLARFKLNRFLAEMEAEFGPKEGRFPFVKNGDRTWEVTLDFIKSELASAECLARTVLGVVDPNDADEWNRIQTDMVIRDTVSPYEDCSDPKVAARITAALVKNQTERAGPPQAPNSRNAMARKSTQTPSQCPHRPA